MKEGKRFTAEMPLDEAIIEPFMAHLKGQVEPFSRHYNISRNGHGVLIEETSKVQDYYSETTFNPETSTLLTKVGVKPEGSVFSDDGNDVSSMSKYTNQLADSVRTAATKLRSTIEFLKYMSFTFDGWSSTAEPCFRLGMEMSRHIENHSDLVSTLRQLAQAPYLTDH